MAKKRMSRKYRKWTPEYFVVLLVLGAMGGFHVDRRIDDMEARLTLVEYRLEQQENGGK